MFPRLANRKVFFVRGIAHEIQGANCFNKRNPYSVSRSTTSVLVLEKLVLVQTILVGKGLANFRRSVGEGVGEGVGRYRPTTDLA